MSGILGSDYLGNLALGYVSNSDIQPYYVENTKSFATTNLSAAINDSVTAIPVFTLSTLPAAPFRICVSNSEIMLVQSINTADLQLNVLRAQEGTSAASHAKGASVANVLTKEGVKNYAESLYMFGQENARPAPGRKGRIYQPINKFYKWFDDGTNWRLVWSNFVLPASNLDFRQMYLNDPVNSTVQVSAGGEAFCLKSNYVSGGTYCYLRSSSYPTPPFTLDCVLLLDMNRLQTHTMSFGYHNSDATFKTFGATSTGNDFFTYFRDTMTNDTTASASNGYTENVNSYIHWLRMVDDNTNIKFYYSDDNGATYIQAVSETRSATADSLIFGGVYYTFDQGQRVSYLLSAYLH